MRERLHESGEMYLKVIERLTRGKSTVQPIEIAEELGYVKSSVSRAIKLLRGKGLITVNETNGVSLTPSGRRRAEQLRHKYEVLRSLFVSIGAEERMAEEAACKIEHCVTDALCGLIALYTPEFQERREKPVPNTNESEEMYLETILRLEESGQEPDLTNIAREMKVTKPAIIKARQKLCDLGFARHDTHNIYLTPLGREIAERVYEKHKLFTRLLRSMGVSRERAEEDACRIEHIVSDETVESVRRYMENKD